MTSLIVAAVGLLYILLWMRPPLRTPLLKWWQGIIAAVVIVFGFLIINTLVANDTFELIFAWLVIWALVAIVGICIVSRTPRHKGDVTWAAAMVGTTFVFAMFFLWYAIIPNEWILWANNGLGWTPDNILVSPNPFPFTITYAHLNDVVATLPYIVGTVLAAYLFKFWQQRPDPVDALATPPESDEPASVAGGDAYTGEVRTSRFGRPVKSRA